MQKSLLSPQMAPIIGGHYVKEVFRSGNSQPISSGDLNSSVGWILPTHCAFYMTLQILDTFQKTTSEPSWMLFIVGKNVKNRTDRKLTQRNSAEAII